jgi:UDP-glucose 4-epimerase
VRDATNGVWTADELASLNSDFAEVFSGRTVLVTGADGFMGSHLTEALVHLGARVHAFVRATSSGALNNIVHLRRQLKVHFADLTDRASVDYLLTELGEAPDKPYVFHLGAQAHVGESWHRPYETVMANTVGPSTSFSRSCSKGSSWRSSTQRARRRNTGTSTRP